MNGEKSASFLAHINSNNCDSWKIRNVRIQYSYYHHSVCGICYWYSPISDLCCNSISMLYVCVWGDTPLRR